MRIGFVSTWFERGAAYVTKSYIRLLEDEHDVFVYARGGEKFGKGDPNWDYPYVTWGPVLLGTNINFRHFKKWVKNNKLDVIFFNEQHEIDTIYKLKKIFPEIKLGSYVDYYKESTVKEFQLYDFLICNTKRHAFVFNDHPQSYYVPWGTDTSLFQPKNLEGDGMLKFFHSAGMSNRKGTTFVIEAFIKGDIYRQGRLIIHTQKEFEKTFGYEIKELKQYNIEIIEKTVSAPGLYHLGDIYVYPTMLDGLGLTMYESLACGLPVITTDHAPMNEVVNSRVGRLVEVDYLRSRSDGYYWPLAIVKEQSLIDAMKYYCENKDQLSNFKRQAREEAVKLWEWSERKKEIKNIFEQSTIIVKEPSTKFIAKRNLFDKLKIKLGSSYIYSIINTFSKRI